MKTLELNRRKNAWETRTCFPVMQTFFFHIIYHLLMYDMAYFIYDQSKNAPANLWTPLWHSRLDMYDVCFLLVVDCGTFGVKVEASIISHDSVRCGLFSSRSFRAEEIRENHYGTLAYSGWTKQWQD